MSLLRPCLDCGELIARGPRCPVHTPDTHAGRTRKERGYDAAWDRLSRRARAAQPWCTDCGRTDDLTTDHTPAAWQRQAAGKPLRLVDVEVVCRACNTRRGAARPELLAAGARHQRDDLRPTPGDPHNAAFSPTGKDSLPITLRTVLTKEDR